MDNRRKETLRSDFEIWMHERGVTEILTGTEYNIDDMVDAFIAGYELGYDEAY